MNNKFIFESKVFLWAGLVLISSLVASGMTFVLVKKQQDFNKVISKPQPIQNNNLKIYRNEKYGFEFMYPDSFYLDPRDKTENPEFDLFLRKRNSLNNMWFGVKIVEFDAKNPDLNGGSLEILAGNNTYVYSPEDGWIQDIDSYSYTQDDSSFPQEADNEQGVTYYEIEDSGYGKDGRIIFIPGMTEPDPEYAVEIYSNQDICYRTEADDCSMYNDEYLVNSQLIEQIISTFRFIK